MLSKDEIKKIALDECVQMLGAELVSKHEDLCCCAYGENGIGLFEYILGMDTKETEYKMGDEKPMQFYAFVVVDPRTGIVTRDYEKSILPS